jgi:DNA gyrase subunit B
VQKSIERLSRRYAIKLLQRLIYMPTLTSVTLKDKARMQEFVIALQERLAEDQNGGSRYDVSLGFDTRNNMYEILVTRTEHGNVTHSRIDAEISGSAEYKAMRSLGERLEDLFTAEAVIERAEKSEAVSNFDTVLKWLMIEARRGQTIQRYKGLGEMNPEQLWETTMDPAIRRLLKVNVDDAVAADEVFTTLMGEQVEPRREFIEKNALAVANLDI